MKYIDLGRKVNKLRKENGYTAEGLAEACEGTTATIRHIEAARRAPSLDTLVKLCNTLKVSADFLLSEYIVFERHPDKHDIYKRLDTLSPKQLDLLNEVMSTVLEHTD